MPAKDLLEKMDHQLTISIHNGPSVPTNGSGCAHFDSVYSNKYLPYIVS